MATLIIIAQRIGNLTWGCVSLGHREPNSYLPDHARKCPDGSGRRINVITQAVMKELLNRFGLDCEKEPPDCAHWLPTLLKQKRLSRGKTRLLTRQERTNSIRLNL